MRSADEKLFPAKTIAMATKNTSEKIECLNPNTGGRMNIDKKIYDLFAKAIHHSLKQGRELTYSQLVEGIYDYFKKQNIHFDGSVEWYAVTVKNDMEARSVIESFIERGKKLNRIKK